jgi:hypothetical protein
MSAVPVLHFNGMARYRVLLTFEVDLLGAAPLNKKIYEDFIASKPGAPPEALEEVATIAVEDKGKTGFHRLPDGTPMIYSYVIKGFLKDACGMLGRIDGTLSKKIRAYKKVVDGLIFANPRMIPINLAGAIGELQRPLRAQTMQGERIALAFSETIPSGSTTTFELTVLDDKAIDRDLLEEWFSYGSYRGLGQWRSASWGSFTADLERIK